LRTTFSFSESYRPIYSFIKNNSIFDPTKLESIRFIFDCFDNGIIMLDDIGFSK